MSEREMTLQEWVERLPEIHTARREYNALRSQLADIESQNRVMWDVANDREARLAEAELSRDSWKREAELNQQAADESAEYARRLAEAEALLRECKLDEWENVEEMAAWQDARDAFLAAGSASGTLQKFAADLAAAQRPLDPEVARVLYENKGDLYMTDADQPDEMDRPWQEIVKDATRYMWLRRRVDTAPAHGLYPWSDAAAMDAAIDAGMAAASQPEPIANSPTAKGG